MTDALTQITPPFLNPGDSIAIISPATTVAPDLIDGATEWIKSHGWKPILFPHAKGPADGTFASTIENRLNDLSAAIADPDIKAILCSRGGYGCVHLIDHIPISSLRLNPKWIIGFSDVSALHALWNRAGILSIHGSMAKHLAETPDRQPARHLYRILSGAQPDPITIPTEKINQCGHAQGILLGGNLAVLDGLAATPFDMLQTPVTCNEPIILFFEDIAEPIYKVERILWRLHLSGVIAKARGLVFGQFTDYKADRNFPSMETMISRRLKEWGYTDNGKEMPVAFNFPCGHFPGNLPLIEGASTILDIDTENTSLCQTINYPQ